MKNCTKCKENKELNDFYKSKTNKNGVMTFCKICDNARREGWRDKNRKKVNNTNRIYKESNSDKVKKWEKTYRENNADQIKSLGIKFRKANPGKVNAITAKRRAAKLQATPKWLTKTQLLEMQAFYIEAARITKETGIKHHVDHIFPLQAINDKGERVGSGMHVPWNLRTVTASKNCSDGAKLIPKSQSNLI